MTNAQRHKQREAKAARRRRRIETGKRPRRVNMLALSSQGADRMAAAVATLPTGFGKASVATGQSAESLIERVFGAVKDRVAA